MPLPRFTSPIPPKVGAADLNWLSRFWQVVTNTSSGYIPSYTTAQKNALSPGSAPAIIFDSTLGKACVWTGSAWQTITSA